METRSTTLRLLHGLFAAGLIAVVVSVSFSQVLKTWSSSPPLLAESVKEGEGASDSHKLELDSLVLVTLFSERGDLAYHGYCDQVADQCEPPLNTTHLQRGPPQRATS